MTDEKLWITFDKGAHRHLLMQDRVVIGEYRDRIEASQELDHILDTGRGTESRYQPSDDAIAASAPCLSVTS